VQVTEPLGYFKSYVEHHSSSATLSGLLAKLNRYTDLEASEVGARPRDHRREIAALSRRHPAAGRFRVPRGLPT
jgi:hypothetical protein